VSDELLPKELLKTLSSNRLLTGAVIVVITFSIFLSCLSLLHELIGWINHREVHFEKGGGTKAKRARENVISQI
jgi:hypothetical protein